MKSKKTKKRKKRIQTKGAKGEESFLQLVEDISKIIRYFEANKAKMIKGRAADKKK